MEFRRWGNLIPQKHKPDSLKFHSAPVDKGVRKYVEFDQNGKAVVSDDTQMTLFTLVT